jgi:tRNA A37 threonylcarbamoyladenosine dehydratase
VVYARPDGSLCGRKEEGIDLRLDCHSGFGAASFVTGAFGLVAASRVVQQLSQAKVESRTTPASFTAAELTEMREGVKG